MEPTFEERLEKGKAFETWLKDYYLRNKIEYFIPTYPNDPQGNYNKQLDRIFGDIINFVEGDYILLTDAKNGGNINLDSTNEFCKLGFQPDGEYMKEVVCNGIYIVNTNAQSPEFFATCLPNSPQELELINNIRVSNARTMSNYIGQVPNNYYKPNLDKSIEFLEYIELLKENTREALKGPLELGNTFITIHEFRNYMDLIVKRQIKEHKRKYGL